MSILKRLASTALVLAVAVALPRVATAQLSDPVLDVEHDLAVAHAYDGSMEGFERAVVMHSQVVHERMPHDARRFECLKSHANLLYYAGHLEAARIYMAAAAEQAVTQRSDYEAAMTFIDAALVAKEAGDVGEALRLADRATALTTSPRLEPDQRTAILDRLAS